MKIFLLTLVLTLALAACDYGGKNPGGHSPEEISRVASEPPRTASPRAPAVEASAAGSGSYDGQQLYSQYCGICHNEGKTAPSLAGVFGRGELPSGTPANDARVKDTIKMGRTMMPAFGGTLNDGQIDAIVAYLHTM
jgi:mono/diheme cytochrome c family protein